MHSFLGINSPNWCSQNTYRKCCAITTKKTVFNTLNILKDKGSFMKRIQCFASLQKLFSDDELMVVILCMIRVRLSSHCTLMTKNCYYLFFKNLTVRRDSFRQLFSLHYEKNSSYLHCPLIKVLQVISSHELSFLFLENSLAHTNSGWRFWNAGDADSPWFSSEEEIRVPQWKPDFFPLYFLY